MFPLVSLFTIVHGYFTFPMLHLIIYLCLWVCLVCVSLYCFLVTSPLLSFCICFTCSFCLPASLSHLFLVPLITCLCLPLYISWFCFIVLCRFLPLLPLILFCYVPAENTYGLPTELHLPRITGQKNPADIIKRHPDTPAPLHHQADIGTPAMEGWLYVRRVPGETVLLADMMSPGAALPENNGRKKQYVPQDITT
ncbi:hypothetical protein AMECASPLE_007457 [Ameca splendens]|uniref:Uncharacterized protein n=1 Tax=Ameca splendens TaxID=208324 RepID=A0ABV0YAQ8_9TELE